MQYTATPTALTQSAICINVMLSSHIYLCNRHNWVKSLTLHSLSISHFSHYPQPQQVRLVIKSYIVKALGKTSLGLSSGWDTDTHKGKREAVRQVMNETFVREQSFET